MRDIVYALELGVDEVGLVFAGGPRSMTVDRALPLIRRVYKETAKRPLVTMLLMNQSAKEIASLIEVLEPEQLQFHGQDLGTDLTFTNRSKPVITGMETCLLLTSCRQSTSIVPCASSERIFCSLLLKPLQLN